MVADQVTSCQQLFEFTYMQFESGAPIRMPMAEVDELEEFGEVLHDLIWLWKCVEKSEGPQFQPLCGSPGLFLGCYSVTPAFHKPNAKPHA